LPCPAGIALHMEGRSPKARVQGLEEHEQD